MAAKKKTTRKKAATAKKNKGGRPRMEFDLEEVYKLGQICATHEEMAGWLGCSVFTIEERMRSDEGFSRAYKSGSGNGKASLRRELVSIAYDREHPKQVTALIFLAKNYLGMSDRVTQDTTVRKEQPGVLVVPEESSYEDWVKRNGGELVIDETAN